LSRIRHGCSEAFDDAANRVTITSTPHRMIAATTTAEATNPAP